MTNIKLPKHTAIYFLLGFLFCASLELHGGSYVFQNYSIAEGLSHKTVNCILQDRQGFVWVGTSDGLNRFDGHTFKKYHKTPDDSLSLQTNEITCIAEDSSGTIWLSTNIGYYCYTPRNDAFYKIKMPGIAQNRLSESVCVDDNGTVWGAENTNQLIRINPKNLQADYIALDSMLGVSAPLYNKKITNAFGYVWVFNDLGVVRFDYRANSAKLLKTDIPFKSPRIIRKGRKNEVLLVDWEKGAYSINTITLEIRPFAGQNKIINKPDVIGITDVAAASDSSVWLMAYPGLYKLHTNGNIESCNRADGYKTDYSEMVYFASMQDRDGNLWIGSQDEGVFVISKKNKAFRHISAQNGSSESMPALKFYVGENELVFANLSGTYYSKTLADAEKGRFVKISNSATLNIAAYNRDEFLLFEKNKVFIYNKRKDAKRLLYETDDMQNGMIDSHGIIWLTHWGEGIEAYEIATGKKYHFNVDTVNKSTNVVFTMLEDADGSIWLGTFGAGLQHLQLKPDGKPLIQQFRYQKGNNSISNNAIISMHDDSQGSLWIGTNGGGLNRFNKKTGLFETYSTSNGLKSNVIQAITSDADGNIWFSSNNITKFDPSTKTFTHYDVNDGIVNKYYNLCAQHGTDRTLYFADDRGILAIKPEEIRSKRQAPTPILTGVRLFGQNIEAREHFNESIPFPTSITFTDSIILPYNLNSLAFEFASIQLPNVKNLIYRYMLEGVDSRWVIASSAERLANYSGLQAGEYVFKIASSNGPDSWSNNRSIRLIITPPWWQTWWFRLLLSLSIILAITAGIYTRFRQLNRQNMLLEFKVAERTEELRQINERLNDDKLVIEIRNSELHEALRSKEKLINILAHDFKNPLQGIYGLAQLLDKESRKNKIAKISEYAGAILTSANSLIQQMLTVLDWAQSNEVEQEANPAEVNLEVLLEDAVSLVKSSAEQKEISIETQSSCMQNAYVDPRMISLIFRNLLSNAIKFTARGGAVTAVITEHDQSINVSVIDNGVGIKADLQKRLLANEGTVPAAGTENEKGTGLGLRLCMTFLEKNNGTLSITSAERQGSVFTISLPKGKTKISKKSKPAFTDEISDCKQTVFEKKFSVLVVDDDAEIVKMLEEVLQPQFNVIHAYNGREGYAVASQLLPDIVISDINMSEMGGIEMCRHLKTNTKTMHMPVLLVSSHNKIEIKTEAFENGANDYIEKPFNPFLLLKKVEALLVLKQNIGEKTRNELTKESYPDVPEGFNSDIMKKVYELVEKNLSTEKLSANSISEQLGVSRTQLWRIFKSETGQSLSDYIKDRRLKKASALLQTSKYRVSEVAFEVGFSSPQYFSRWFTKETGLSPSEFASKTKPQK